MTSKSLTTQLEEINQKILAKEKRLKRYQDNVKQYKQNRTIENKEKYFYCQVGGEYTRTAQQPDAKEAKQFWSKIWKQKEHLAKKYCHVFPRYVVVNKGEKNQDVENLTITKQLAITVGLYCCYSH